jgi:hypothetical protein
MVNVELSGQAASDVSGRFIRSAGLSCRSRSSNQPDEMPKIPARRCEMGLGTFFFSGEDLPVLLIH